MFFYAMGAVDPETAARFVTGIRHCDLITLVLVPYSGHRSGSVSRSRSPKPGIGCCRAMLGYTLPTIVSLPLMAALDDCSQLANGNDAKVLLKLNPYYLPLFGVEHKFLLGTARYSSSSFHKHVPICSSQENSCH